MMLLVDTGNTHIEIGLYDQQTFVDSWRIATGVHRTEDEMMAFIYQCLRMRNLDPGVIEDMAIASVVPNITQIFSRLSEKYFQKAPLIVNHQLDLGVTIDYDPPHSVGADRICGAVAALEKHKKTCLIVDFGTATTLDVITAEGVYLGGAIAPGLETASHGLYARASKLPKISLEVPQRVIGKNTEESMQSGVMIGNVKMIDGLIGAMKNELPDDPAVIATGGLSRVIAPESQYIEHVDLNLVLDGLMIIYQRNKL